MKQSTKLYCLRFLGIIIFCGLIIHLIILDQQIKSNPIYIKQQKEQQIADSLYRINVIQAQAIQPDKPSENYKDVPLNSDYEEAKERERILHEKEEIRKLSLPKIIIIW